MTTLTAANDVQNQSAQAVAELNAKMRSQAARGVLKALGNSTLTFLLTILAVLGLWVGILVIFNINPMIAKGPVDVWNWMFTVPAAEANRAMLWDNLLVTLGDAAIGFIAGLVAALLLAMLFQLSKGVENALMPVAMLLRSVPLVAMAPVIILIFGRDLWSVAVIGGIVVLFPALVNISFGLKSAPTQMNDLVSVYGGGSWAKLTKIAIPSSLPAFFAAVRISVPGAITGALLAEWLATGGGIGGSIGGFIPQAQFTALWASVVAVTATALVLYNLIQIVEDVVLARMAMKAQRGV